MISFALIYNSMDNLFGIVDCPFLSPKGFEVFFRLLEL
jgi:hypothetical protein